MRGLHNRTPTQTKVLIELAGGCCEDCGSTKNLEIHRIVPAYKNGTYLPRNCKVLCHECHLRYAESW